jgi:predicted nucleic acid-binding protein
LPPSASSAVADAGPLIALGRLDLLGLLPQLFGTVYVPEAVLGECAARPDLPDAHRIHLACDDGRLTRCNASPVAASDIGLGERSAIAAALETRSVLLVDDLAARRHAHSLGLAIVGTLGLLVLAKRAALLPEVRPLIVALRESGHWISDAAVAAALSAAGERE